MVPKATFNCGVHLFSTITDLQFPFQDMLFVHFPLLFNNSSIKGTEHINNLAKSTNHLRNYGLKNISILYDCIFIYQRTLAFSLSMCPRLIPFFCVFYLPMNNLDNFFLFLLLIVLVRGPYILIPNCLSLFFTISAERSNVLFV